MTEALTDRARPRIRVLQILQNLNYGGMERLLADLVTRVDHSRFEPHVLALQYLGRFAQGLDEHAGLHVAGRMSKLSNLKPTSLASQIRAIAPDVVHTHSGVWYKATKAARMASVPWLVHTEHGLPTQASTFDAWLETRAARRTNVVVAVSPSLAESLELHKVKGKARVDIVPNGVDTESFSPGPRDEQLLASLKVQNRPIIGSVGRLEPIKAYHVAIRALHYLFETGFPGTRPALILAGGGSELSRLRALADELGLAGDIVFPGWTDSPVPLYRSYDIFTMSSLSEGTSVSLLEAMSVGICPVITDVGGNADVLGPDLAHRLVASSDPVALATAWRSALADPLAVQHDSRRARERIVSHYSLRSMIERYEQIYAESGRFTRLRPPARASQDVEPMARARYSTSVARYGR